MQPGDTVSWSTLYRPLHQITEDDISQVTREDCHRYLKEQGMRWPSWNKSQAIQQVISLKNLLETAPDSGASDPRPRCYFPRSGSICAPANSSVIGGDTPISASSPDQLIPCRQVDPPNHDFPGDLPFCLTTDLKFKKLNNSFEFVRTTGAVNEPIGQMTIFYCGKVNVFDDVPRNKAKAIMQLAACPLSLSLETSSDAFPALWPIQCQLETPGVKTSPIRPMLIFPTLQTDGLKHFKGILAENCHMPREEEGPTSRRASVQRYLEKRKHRFKNKRKAAMPSSASLDVRALHRESNHLSNNQWNLTDACSLTQPRPPQTPTRCSSVEIPAKYSYHSADLNNKGHIHWTVDTLSKSIRNSKSLLLMPVFHKLKVF